MWKRGSLMLVQLHEASLMQGWVRISRILALVERDSTHALFVFLSVTMPPQSFTDLTIERILPIDSEFRCDIGKYSFLFNFVCILLLC